jgi:hypothetical protein
LSAAQFETITVSNSKDEYYNNLLRQSLACELRKKLNKQPNGAVQEVSSSTRCAAGLTPASERHIFAPTATTRVSEEAVVEVGATLETSSKACSETRASSAQANTPTPLAARLPALSKRVEFPGDPEAILRDLQGVVVR